jgi:voltage-gated potassium channel Kch
MSHQTLAPTSRGKLRILWLVIAVLGIVTFVLGFIIFCAKDKQPPNSISKYTSAFYSAAQLLLLHTPYSEMTEPSEDEQKAGQPNQQDIMVPREGQPTPDEKNAKTQSDKNSVLSGGDQITRQPGNKSETAEPSGSQTPKDENNPKAVSDKTPTLSAAQQSAAQPGKPLETPSISSSPSPKILNPTNQQAANKTAGSGTTGWVSIVKKLGPVVGVLAPIVIGLAAALTIFEVFYGLIRLLFVHLASGHRVWGWLGFRKLAKGHVIICGIGGTGLHLIEEFRKLGECVVGIEKNSENERLADARAAGALVVVGDATALGSLRDAGIAHAKSVIAICDRDDTNVEIAVKAARLLKDRFHRTNVKAKCRVHVVDLELTTLFRQHRLLARADDRFQVRVFNFFENSARRLFERFPLEPFKFGVYDPRSIHLVIVGFGQMGRSVALQAVKIGHYANGKKLRISVIDQKANERRGSLYSPYPCFSDVCDIEFFQRDAEEPEILQRMSEWAEEPNFVTTYVICFDDDHRSLGFALRLTRYLKTGAPIRVRMASDTGLASLLSEGNEKAEVQASIRGFGLVYESCGLEEILNERLDRLARAIHEAFLKRRTREGRSGEDPAMLPWDLLEQDYVDSSRQQADHIDVKLRAIGCYRSSDRGGEQVEHLDDQSVELLAEMEHARWKVERRLAGWKYTPSKDGQTPELKTKKLSAYLVDWNQLEETQKDWDRESVRHIPRLVALFNEKISR